MNCILENKIDHTKVEPKFKDTLFFCKLFERKGTGMDTLGTVCGHCCLRCQMVGDVLSSLIRRGDITREQLERDPNTFINQLESPLKEYAEVVAELSGKGWIDIQGICERCKPLEVSPQEVPKAPAQKMSNVGRNEV